MTNATNSNTPTNSNAGWMDTVLDALRSPGAMMVALVLALFPQGEHTAQVFLYFSHDRSSNAQFFAYAFAAAVEVAVLLFVLAGHKRISYLFAGASFLTNVVYYAIGGVAMLTVSVLPVLLLSALLPACIMGYSHTIAEKPAHAPATPAKATRRFRWQFWRKPQEASPMVNDTTSASQTPVALPAGTLGHSSTSAPTDAAPVESPKQAKAGRKVNEYGMTDAQLAALLNVKRQAIAPMRTRGTLTTRIARELPQLTAVHTNGVNHD